MAVDAPESGNPALWAEGLNVIINSRNSSCKGWPANNQRPTGKALAGPLLGKWESPAWGVSRLEFQSHVCPQLSDSPKASDFLALSETQREAGFGVRQIRFKTLAQHWLLV